MRELGVRGGQELAKISERVGGSSSGEMSDRTFIRHTKRARRGSSAESTAARITDRIRSSIRQAGCFGHHTFFPSLGCRDEIVSIMREGYERELEAIVERADRAVEGRFDVLGFPNLSFGNPPDWRLEPASGKRSPLAHWSKIAYLDPSAVGDTKITWELNRHQHFVILGQAYWITGDERYAESFVNQATSWMDANPPKLGINWVSSLEVALRSIAWLWALHLFAGSRHLTAGFELRLIKTLLAHGLHIQTYLSHYFSPNTHLTGEALGLFYLGTAVPELRRAETWRKLGLKIMLDELSRQVRNDGVYFEQASYYHRYTADFYTHLLILARANNADLPAEVQEKLAQMITHLMFIMRPDGTSPLIGDDDGGRLIVLGPRQPGDFRDTLATAAALYGRGDWKSAAGAAPVETLWLLGPDAVNNYAELHADEPRTSSHVFESSGYSVMRDGWSKESSYTLMDCGPHGSLTHGHAHADALSIEFAALGQTWIVDPGTFTYTSNPELRDWFRSTRGHNTVTVDGKSQSVPSGPFSWKQVAHTSLDDFIIDEAFDYIHGSHDGYERLIDPVTHRRAVMSPKARARDKSPASLPGYLIVQDAFSASGQHDYAIWYHLSPECTAFASENHVTVSKPGGYRLNIMVFGQSRLRTRIVKSWVSRVYGQRERSLAVVFEASGQGPQEFTTLLIPAFERQSISVEHHPIDYRDARGFQVVSDGMRDVILVGNSSGPINCGQLTAEAAFAWARFENSCFSRGFFIQGRRFETSDGLVFRASDTVKHCVLRSVEKRIEGAINDGTLFDLANGEESREFTIDGTTFEVCQPVMLFAGEKSEFGSINNTSGAIN